MSDATRRKILQHGPAAIPPLIDVIEDIGLANLDAPGGGWAPIHAVVLLAQLQAEQAVEPMLTLLENTEWHDIVHDRCINALMSMGRAALEPTLAACGRTDDESLRAAHCAILGGLGVRDARILEVLLEKLRRVPDGGAANLAEYGDEQAIEHLHAAFDTFVPVTSEDLFANQTMIEIRAAIEELGGTLSAEQETKYERAMEGPDRTRRRLRAAMTTPAQRSPDTDAIQPPPFGETTAQPVRRSRKIGRNEPGWCGSGKKYKKCHLTTDEGR